MLSTRRLYNALVSILLRVWVIGCLHNQDVDINQAISPALFSQQPHKREFSSARIPVKLAGEPYIQGTQCRIISAQLGDLYTTGEFD